MALIVVILLLVSLWGIILLQHIEIKQLENLLGTYMKAYQQTYKIYIDTSDKYIKDIEEWSQWLDLYLKENANDK